MVYERITRKLRYSLIRFSYLIFALCFRSICETAEKNVPLNMIKKKCSIHISAPSILQIKPPEYL